MQMQSVFEWNPEVKMENTDQTKLNALETQDFRSNLGLSALGRRALKAFVCLVEPQPDLNHLSARLREDARIDELELERSRVARAKIIR
jgi:hypothetical protein